jgi:alpha-L-fucosidase
VLLAVPHGDYPAYADAQVRELIRRYRPSVLWNDIAWPSGGKLLWPLFEHYYTQVPDGVVNDRWMPWNPVLGTLRVPAVSRRLDRILQSQAKRDRGLIPPRPPHFDVRTPEYVTFETVQRESWECVRGMDQSFGHNAASRPEHFLPRDELLWMFVDIAAKGGNLLLNVGPRGTDAQIPELQLARLDWLAEWVTAHAEALFATRPWVRPGTIACESEPVRYTSRGDTLFAFVRDARGPVTLPDVAPTPTTTVKLLGGRPLGWHASPAGIAINDLGPRPGEISVIALNQVTTRPASFQPSS